MLGDSGATLDLPTHSDAFCCLAAATSGNDTRSHTHQTILLPKNMGIWPHMTRSLSTKAFRIPEMLATWFANPRPCLNGAQPRMDSPTGLVSTSQMWNCCFACCGVLLQDSWLARSWRECLLEVSVSACNPLNSECQYPSILANECTSILRSDRYMPSA